MITPTLETSVTLRKKKLFFYLSSVVQQQCHGIRVAQVSVDAQQGGVVEDIAPIIHISPAQNQQPAHLDR